MEWQNTKKKRDTRNYMRYAEAERLGKSLNIVGFADAMVSQESRQLQDQGFQFDRVLKGNEESSAVGDDAVALPINNKYGDSLVFVMK